MRWFPSIRVVCRRCCGPLRRCLAGINSPCDVPSAFSVKSAFWDRFIERETLAEEATTAALAAPIAAPPVSLQARCSMVAAGAPLCRGSHPPDVHAHAAALAIAAGPTAGPARPRFCCPLLPPQTCALHCTDTIRGSAVGLGSHRCWQMDRDPVECVECLHGP